MHHFKNLQIEHKWLNNRCVVIESPTTKDGWQKLARAVDKFFELFGEEGLAISFDYSSRSYSSILPKLAYWRLHLSTEEELKNYHEGFVIAKNLVDSLPKEAREFIISSFPDINQASFRARVMTNLIENNSRPTLIVMSDISILLSNLASSRKDIPAQSNALEPITNGISAFIRISRPFLAYAKDTLVKTLSACIKWTRRSYNFISGKILRARSWRTLIKVGPSLAFAIACRFIRYVVKLLCHAFSLFSAFGNNTKGIGSLVVRGLFDKTVPLSTALIIEFNIIKGVIESQPLKSAGYFFSSKLGKLNPAGKTVMMIIEDSGSNINLTPGLKVAREIISRGIAVIVLSSYKRVVDEFTRIGAHAFLFPTTSLSIPSNDDFSQYISTKTLLEELSSKESYLVNHLVMHSVQSGLRSYFLARSGILEAVSKIHESANIRALLSVNEAIRSPVISAQFLGKYGIKWVAYDPILLFDHPDSRFFPADIHLVYGSQLAELIAKYCPQSDFPTVVGSVLFDNALEAGMQVDDSFAGRHLNGYDPSRQKLVVVGTENRNRQNEEIVPVLLALSKFDNVYVVLKLHPDDSLNEFTRLVNDIGLTGKVHVIKSIPIEPLLKISDLLICMRSNISVMAASLRTPVLMCDFTGSAEFVDFAEEGLAAGCYNEDELPETIYKLLFDEFTRDKVIQKMNNSISRFNGPNDGMSHVRVADFIERLIS